MLLKNKFHVSLCYNVQQALRKAVTSFVPVICSYITIVLYVLLIVADCYLLLIVINCFVLTVNCCYQMRGVNQIKIVDIYIAYYILCLYVASHILILIYLVDPLDVEWTWTAIVADVKVVFFFFILYIQYIATSMYSNNRTHTVEGMSM